jgi:hypothetical protein
MKGEGRGFILGELQHGCGRFMVAKAGSVNAEIPYR